LRLSPITDPFQSFSFTNGQVTCQKSRKKMNRPRRKTLELVRAVCEAGFRAILLWMAIEIILIVVALGIGISVWMRHGFPSGLVSGMVAFGVGQAIATLIMDMTFQLPERTTSGTALPSDKEVLDALRVELASEAASEPRER